MKESVSLLFSPDSTEAGDVAVHPDVFEAPLGRLRLRGVALAHVVHGEHVLLAELSVVVEVDLCVEANHWRDGGAGDALKARLRQ